MAFTRRQQQVAAAKETVVETVVTSDDEEESSDTETSETLPIKTEDEAKIEPIEVAEVVEVVEEKMVTIVPRVTLTSTRIGPKMYSFLKGVPIKVPSGVKSHLQEKGII